MGSESVAIRETPAVSREWVAAGPPVRASRNVRRASRGDVGAFRELVREHSGLVYGVASRVLGERDVQDASQEVWIRVWRNIRNFRGDSAFTTWLHRIATNTCLDLRRVRLRRREDERGEGATVLLAEPSGGDGDPEAAALNAERRREMEAALEHVRTDHRAALVLRHMQGLSYAEISEALGVPNGTAKGWVNRGRTAMLGVLKRPDEEGTGDA